MGTICVDSRNKIENCAAVKGARCIALVECMNPCPFYKPRSVREKELREIRKRGIAPKGGGEND